MMVVSGVFSQITQATATSARYVILRGGTRSGKTYAILQLLLLLTAKSKGLLVSVVSETFPHLRRGAMADLRAICESDGLPWEAWWNASTATLSIPDGGRLEFFSADAPAKVHGPARDILFLNEAQNISQDTARQLFVRTRERIFLDYNPVRLFWAEERYEPRDDAVVISSTYRDNPFLTAAQVREIESYRSDAAWWRVYGEGLTGKNENVILEFTQEEGYGFAAAKDVAAGLDFGFTNDPTAAVLVAVDHARRQLHAAALLYDYGLTNQELAARLAERLAAYGLRAASVPVYCDAAEPKSIEELRRSGVNATACLKTRSVTEQLQWLRGWGILVDKGATALVKELRGYLWATDRDGNALNVPVAGNDHAIDALRYAAWARAHGGAVLSTGSERLRL